MYEKKSGRTCYWQFVVLGPKRTYLKPMMGLVQECESITLVSYGQEQNPYNIYVMEERCNR